jgi:hypothetical protein
MLVDPEPLLGMSSDDRFEAIPAGLHYLGIGGTCGELRGSKTHTEYPPPGRAKVINGNINVWYGR